MADEETRQFLADLLGEPDAAKRSEPDEPDPLSEGERDHVAELMGWDSPEPESEDDKPADFDGGCRTPVEPSPDPLGDHNELLVDLANGLPPREQGGWR